VSVAEINARVGLLQIGCGSNGVGVAGNAAGRGLEVLLADKDDLAAATSSAHSKLIHGGFRYPEHCEFRLADAPLVERGRAVRSGYALWRWRNRKLLQTTS
jgi:glycerol-3-phosphate dehydrogenase